MRFGVGAVNSLAIEGAAAMREYARAADDLGFDFLTLIDHVVTAYPAADGTSRFHYPTRTPYDDIMVVLGYLAGVTERIRLRTAVVILPLRGPVVVAKQAAAADLLSGGRVDLGVGIGSQEAEYGTLGVPWRERGRRLDEGIAVMKELWTKDRVSFSGEFYTIDDMAMEQKPAQQPHPPLWFGGTVPAAWRRTVDHGAGWQARPVQTIDEIAASWVEIRSMAEGAGRDPGELRMQATVALGPERPTAGIVEAIRSLQAAGATDISLTTSYQPGLDTAADHLGQLERARREIVPEF